MKAKYIVIVEVVKKALWLRGLVSNLGLLQQQTVVLCDSQSVIHLTKSTTNFIFGSAAAVF